MSAHRVVQIDSMCPNHNIYIKVGGRELAKAMVLWELTLATAYVLGLRRTYRLALRIQRKVLPRNQRLRDFAHRRTRAVFDMAIKVQKKLEHWNTSTGERLGNWILRRTSDPALQSTIDPAKPIKKKVISFPAFRAPIADGTENSVGKMPLLPKPHNESSQKSRLTAAPSMPNRNLVMKGSLGWQPVRRNVQNLYTAAVPLEMSRLNSHVIREDIAVYAGLQRTAARRTPPLSFGC